MSETDRADEQLCPECGEPRRLYLTNASTRVTGSSEGLDVVLPEEYGCANSECKLYEPAAEPAEDVDEEYADGRVTHQADEAAAANTPTGGGNIGA